LLLHWFPAKAAMRKGFILIGNHGNEENQKEKKYESDREGRRYGLLAAVADFRCRVRSRYWKL